MGEAELLEAVRGPAVKSLKATDVYRTPHAIWDTWITILIILSLLSVEWWLRKRFNLL